MQSENLLARKAGNFGVDRNVTIKWIIKKYSVKGDVRICWFVTGSSGGFV